MSQAKTGGAWYDEDNAGPYVAYVNTKAFGQINADPEETPEVELVNGLALTHDERELLR